GRIGWLAPEQPNAAPDSVAKSGKDFVGGTPAVEAAARAAAQTPERMILFSLPPLPPFRSRIGEILRSPIPLSPQGNSRVFATVVLIPAAPLWRKAHLHASQARRHCCGSGISCRPGGHRHDGPKS